ncbi:MAG: ferritin family protein [Solirubrobacteraceae bacterium]
MGFDQYHEPPDELSQEARTFARLCASLTEEAEAIGWYEQRLAVERDPEAAAVMRNAQGEEFKHFSMDLELLLRRTPRWREVARRILFRPGDVVAHGEGAEEAALDEDGGS